MAKNRAKKESEVSVFASGLREAGAIVFADLSRLKVNESSELRRTSKKDEVKVKAAKKTLLRFALKEAGIESVDVKAMGGSVSMLLGYGDPVAPARIIEKFRKDREALIVLGGLFENRWMTAAQVKELSALPSKQELIARVVGSISAPLSGLVNVLQGNLRNLVYVVNAIKDSKSA